MNKIHYRNIGYPKTGTNWLWKQLMSHPQVDAGVPFMYKEFNTPDLEKYKQIYKNYDVSVNLDTHVFALMYPDTHICHPKNIHTHTTHITLTFRNLYDVLNSLYNMDKNRNPNFKTTAKEFASMDNPKLKLYCDLYRIFEGWKECKIPVQYMFYDDLQKDPKEYMHNLCRYIGLSPFYDKKIGITFKTDINEQLIFEDDAVIKYINNGISIIEDHTKRDLSHWKK